MCVQQPHSCIPAIKRPAVDDTDTPQAEPTSSKPQIPTSQQDGHTSSRTNNHKNVVDPSGVTDVGTCKTCKRGAWAHPVCIVYLQPALMHGMQIPYLCMMLGFQNGTTPLLSAFPMEESFHDRRWDAPW